MHPISVPRALVVAVFAAAISAPVRAATSFTYSGIGGVIPDPASTPGTWNVTYTGVPFTSSVNVIFPVTSVTAVNLMVFTHTRRGDLHLILKDPNSVAYNLIVRPGSNGTSNGDSGDYLTGNYSIVEAGGSIVSQGSTDISGGTYTQFFNIGSGQWSTLISNTPLGSITGPAGLWTLEIRDWTPGDVGTLHGWQLQGFDSGGSLGTPFCFSDAACPCGPGVANAGCENENGGTPTGGAVVDAVSSGGPASVTADSGATQITLNMTNAAFLKTSIFFEANASAAPVLLGDGLFCLTGSTIRLNGAAPAGDSTDGTGGLSYPNGVHSLSICQRYTQALGGAHPQGSFHYQVAYRDPVPDTCPGGGTFNTSSGLTLVWGP